ncbi:MAG TPA: M14 family zinc carboxypeptidase [Longimicrobiales bacterium]|nr:M14 family zinc carboxypeptidase [Longimicrobiales bacterium]
MHLDCALSVPASCAQALSARSPRAPLRRAALAAAATLAALGAATTLAALAAAIAPHGLAAQDDAEQPMEDAYAERVRAHTTEPRFLSDLVDHLPDHPNVPSPLDHFGSVIGAEGVLHYVDEINGYLRALADASPRVATWVIGTSDEGREMLAVAVADEATIAAIDRHKEIARRLADPRGLSAGEADRLIADAKPIYYATMGLHSPETGPPEMAMEVAYRLAVEESPFIRGIRDNLVFVFTPVVETDGRDRIVDWYYREKEWKAQAGIPDSLEVPGFPPPPYWGKYVYHDNNRDGLQLSQTLTQVMMEAYLDWRPLVFHDLHQSVPLLYVSTGTGPYNQYIDPVVVSEWNQIAYHEIAEMTRRGMPGVWTHGFYTGWSPSYLFYMGNLRNGIGRFYETFGGDADTEWEVIGGRSEVAWYRTNPPPDTVLWSLRNNTNYMQTGLLLALQYVADHGDALLRNFYRKGLRQIERGRREAPHAYAIPAAQPRAREAANLANLLRHQGVEVHRLTAPVTIEVGADDAPVDGDGVAATARITVTGVDPSGRVVARSTVSREAAERPADDGAEPGVERAPEASATRELAAGDWVVRLDQPYHVVARQILGIQNYPEGEQIPYDDTGWTLSLLRNVEAIEVADSSILDAPMEVLAADAVQAGILDASAGDAWYAIPYRSQNELISFRYRHRGVRMFAAEAAFEAGGRSFPRGTVLIEGGGGGRSAVTEAAREFGLDVVGLAAAPAVARHELDAPRIAFVHTWGRTQDSGWVRYALDAHGIPFDYISEQDVGGRSDLRSRWDVIVFPHARGDSRDIVHGAARLDAPVAWKRTERYRHIGVIDETDDLAGGMGLRGLANLEDFARAGGTLITIGSVSRMVLDFGLVRDVSLDEARGLTARGTVLRAAVDSLGAESPIAYGYAEAMADSLPVYFGGGPVLDVPDRDARETRDRFPTALPRSRPIIRFGEAAGLLLSGGLSGAGALAGKAAVTDTPVGRGHIVMFGIRPFWRWETHGSMPLVFNALLHWNDLGVAWE